MSKKRINWWENILDLHKRESKIFKKDQVYLHPEEGPILCVSADYVRDYSNRSRYQFVWVYKWQHVKMDETLENQKFELLPSQQCKMPQVKGNLRKVTMFRFNERKISIMSCGRTTWA